MGDEKKENFRGEKIAKSIINNPYFGALSIAILIIMVSLAIVYIQYNQVQSLADSVRSQINVIENEYRRFNDARENYDALVEDIAKYIIKQRPEINDFESLYINSIISDIETLSESGVFKGTQMGDMSLVLYILDKRLKELDIFLKRLSSGPKGIDKQLKSKIISASIKIAAQEQASYLSLESKGSVFSPQKLILMEKALKLSGTNSPIGNTSLQNACIMLISRYEPQYIFNNAYPIKGIIKMAFEFLSIKGKLSDEKLKEILYFNNSLIAKKIFGQNLTKTKIDHLFSRMQKLFELESVKKRVEYYNEWIMKSWYISLDNPGIIFTPISVDDVEPKY